MVRYLTKADLPSAGKIHQEAFPRQKKSQQWLTCALAAYPRTFCFASEDNQKFQGYIIWGQKSGFRDEVVLELEQVAIAKPQRNRGLAKQLIIESLRLVQEDLKKDNAKIKSIVVSTRADNHAQNLYRKVLGADVEATIADLFSADEVIMVAKNINSFRVT